MSLTLNMVGGGGGKLKDTDAVLFVTVPTGSSVIATKGAITLTPTIWTKNADNTLDCAVFIISPSLFDAQNAWTVTSTLGTNSASKTVTIDAADEYEMELYYKLYFYKAGDTSGWTAKAWAVASGGGASTPSLSYNNNVLQLDETGYHSGVVYHTDIIDLTDLQTIVAHGDFSYSRSSRWNGCGIYIFSAISGSYYLSSPPKVAGTELPLGSFTDYDLSVDVSSLSGNYYVALGLVMTSHFTIDEVYGV